MFNQWKKAFIVLFFMLLVPQMTYAAEKPSEKPPESWMDVKSYEERKDFVIDRGELCKYIIKLYEQFVIDPIAIKENRFLDISGEMFPYIVKANSLGLINGITATSFQPSNPVTKGELATMLYAVIQYTHDGIDFSLKGPYIFMDSDKIQNTNTADALSFLFSREIIKAGYNGSIGVNDTLTLKETVTMILNTKNSSPQFQMLVDSYNYKTEVEPEPEGKKAYLTFDDGVSKNTLRILETLDKYHVKATFFVTGDANPNIIKQIADAGHSIGNHSYTHDYKTIYSGETAFWNDFQTEQNALEDIIGYQPYLFRFPGGSNNTVSQHYSPAGFMQKLATQMAQKGYFYYDWNVSSGDASGKKMTKNDIVKAVLNGASGKDTAVILMHQTASKTSTADALPEIIEGLQKMGFTILPITEQTTQIQFLKPE